MKGIETLISPCLPWCVTLLWGERRQGGQQLDLHVWELFSLSTLSSLTYYVGKHKAVKSTQDC